MTSRGNRWFITSFVSWQGLGIPYIHKFFIVAVVEKSCRIFFEFG
jgi:hypothetical protein